MEWNVDNMKLLLIGSGGREHALAWKIAKSKKVAKIFVHQVMVELHLKINVKI